MAHGEALHPLQQKFLEHAALQCGICTPGFLVASRALLEKNPNPTETEIRYVGSTVNPRNRTFQVELVVPNPGRTIKPEMVANIEIVRRILDDAVVIPQDALVRVEDGFVAFVVEEDERGRTVARSRSLVLGPAQRNLVVVREGLEAGDRLVVVGQSQVANRDRVRVVEEHRPVRDTAQSEGGER
jgi:multidrug efflux pump subunit AcrA (membrane-fusion protein)